MKFIKIINSLKNNFKLFIRSDHSRFLIPCDILFFCHDVDRPIKLSGIAYSPLCDSIREDFESKGYKCLSIAHFGSFNTGNRGFGFPLSLERKRILYLFLNKVFSFFLRDYKRYNIFDFILLRTKPRVIITIGSSDSLCRAANRMNILNVELLHGIGYKSIPWGWYEKLPQDLPKVILSLDEISTRTFLPLRKNGIEIFTIPNPFLKRFLVNRKHLLPSEWKLQIPSFGKFKKKILVSLVWGYAGDHHEFSNILKNGLFYDQLIDCVKKNPQIFWCFRFHPVQLQPGKYQALRKFMDDFVLDNFNCEWRQSSFLPFPTVAFECSGNISMSSMSCYDAASVGIPSLLLCPTIQLGGIYEDLFNDLVDEGYVKKMRIDENYLNSWVNEVNKVRPRLSNLLDDSSWERATSYIQSKIEFQVTN
jgi:hypothetical protein